MRLLQQAPFPLPMCLVGALHCPFLLCTSPCLQSPLPTSAQESLAARLPTDTQPGEVAAFLDRMQHQIESRWHLALPPPPAASAACGLHGTL